MMFFWMVNYMNSLSQVIKTSFGIFIIVPQDGCGTTEHDVAYVNLIT